MNCADHTRRRARSFGGRLLRWAQSSPRYRRLATHCAASGIVIDLAIEADVPGIRKLFGLQVGESSDRGGWLSGRDDVTNLMARRGRHVVGVVQLVRRSRDCGLFSGHWSFSLCVHPLARGMGVASALLRASIDLAAAEGAPVLSTLVYEDNSRSLGAYAKAGFVVVDDPAFHDMQATERRSGRCRLVLRRPLP